MVIRQGGGLHGPHRSAGKPDNLTLQTENINVSNSAPSPSINVGAAQNALTANIVPLSPHP
jgi:hypothetical protein